MNQDIIISFPPNTITLKRANIFQVALDDFFSPSLNP